MQKMIAVWITLGLLGLFSQTDAPAQGTVFTYQGKLNQNGAPFTGVAEIAPTLWDAPSGGNPVATNTPATILVNVSTGLFTASLDFGSAPFVTGAARWLQLGVRTTIGPFTPLLPLQPLTSTPYAITAGYAVTASNVSGSLNAGNLGSGTVPLARLSGITSNQLDAGTWQFLVNLATSRTNATTNGITTGTNGMVLIPGGEFTMGDTLDGATNAAPVTVNISSSFYMDVMPVTWAQWQGVYSYATNHGYTFVYSGAGKGLTHPVQTVDWYDVVKWCNARAEQAGKVPVYYTDAGLTTVYRTGEVAPYANWVVKGYRLPTEAEWEKAARGGVAGHRFPWGDLISQTNANYCGAVASFAYDLGPSGYNPIGSFGGGPPYTSPVGSFAPNGYGLYDMAGNVWEWCWDYYGTPYSGGTDPRGVSIGSRRVMRGSGCLNTADFCRTAYRFHVNPAAWDRDFGFRSVLPVGQ